jgi:hypothetical protein
MLGCAIMMLALASAAPAQEPPEGLIKRVAQNEAQTEEARSRYLYTQTVLIEEMSPRGAADGRYKEIREVIFSPQGERSERLQGAPLSALKRLVLTKEDFEDIRNIQPLLLTPETLPRYKVEFKGDETVDGIDCWVLKITPKQLFAGFRMFEGMAWVEKSELRIVRTLGQAVPPIYSRDQENLFPRFTTFREKVDGMHWFPALTHADDTLPFKNGPLRLRMRIEYRNYKRFGAESTITFEEPKAAKPLQ